jgi:hypothetical protein
MPPLPTPGGTASVRGAGLRLVGVVHARDTERLAALDPELQAVAFRDVAVVARTATGRPAADEAASLAHHRDVALLARLTTVVPAPPATQFRSAGAVRQWLELHASALEEALAHVEGRVMARVTACRDLENASSDPDVLPPSAAAAESFRVLRRHAVAAVAIAGGTAGDGTTIATEAFLVDRVQWDAFATEVVAEDERSPGLALRLTGPWPPYDFVRLQFTA